MNLQQLPIKRESLFLMGIFGFLDFYFRLFSLINWHGIIKQDLKFLNNKLCIFGFLGYKQNFSNLNYVYNFLDLIKSWFIHLIFREKRHIFGTSIYILSWILWIWDDLNAFIEIWKYFRWWWFGMTKEWCKRNLGYVGF